MAETHVIAQGESISTIAHRYQFTNWKSIWDAPENAELRKIRSNPGVLSPGDKVFIPDNPAKSVSVSTGQRHELYAIKSTWVVRLEMKDEDHVAIEGEPFVLELGGGVEVSGKTKAGGVLEVPVHPDARLGKLHFMGQELDVDIGKLDPISQISGIQARLNNLGFDAGPVDGILGPRTQKAIAAFQVTQHDIIPAGQLDDKTRARILATHDNDHCVVPPEGQ